MAAVQHDQATFQIRQGCLTKSPGPSTCRGLLFLRLLGELDRGHAAVRACSAHRSRSLANRSGALGVKAPDLGRGRFHFAQFGEIRKPDTR